MPESGSRQSGEVVFSSTPLRLLFAVFIKSDLGESSGERNKGSREGDGIELKLFTCWNEIINGTTERKYCKQYLGSWFEM